MSEVGCHFCGQKMFIGDSRISTWWVCAKCQQKVNEGITLWDERQEMMKRVEEAIKATEPPPHEHEWIWHGSPKFADSFQYCCVCMRIKHD